MSESTHKKEMRSVRIYKDDIRIHILRSLFFTDTVLITSSAVVIAGLVYLFFHSVLGFFNWGYFISSVFVADIFFVGLITQKIDNQPIFKIIPRAVTFKASNKERRYMNIDPYFTNFSIQDNLIIRPQSVIRIFEIEPFDIALLNDQDREHFYAKLKQALHVLPAQVQFIVKKEKAASSNYSKHFFSLYKGSNKKRESLISKYIQDISKLVDSENFFITKYYGVLSISCNTDSFNEKVQGIKKLSDVSLRFAGALSICNINVRPLDNIELIQFAKETLR